MNKFHDLIEKFESGDENAFKEDAQKMKSKASSSLKNLVSFCFKNWLLILIVVFSYVGMVNAIEANKYSQQAYDSASDASYSASVASDYAEEASNYAQDAAANSEEAANYARQARDEANNAATNAMLSW